MKNLVNSKTIFLSLFMVAFVSLALSGCYTEKVQTCADSDGGNFPLELGFTDYLKLDNTTKTFNDTCNPNYDNILWEGMCYTNSSGKYFIINNQSCGEDTFGAEYCNGKAIYSDYTDYFCGSGVCDSNVTPYLYQDCGQNTNGSNYCLGKDVYHDENITSCSAATCGSTTSAVLVEDCGVSSEGPDYCLGKSIYYNLTSPSCSVGVCGSTEYPIKRQDCGNDSVSANYCQSDDVFRNVTDYFCSGAACGSDVTPTLIQNCNDNDFYLSNYCSSGDVYRDLNDSSCGVGGCDWELVPELVESCSNGCTAGACNPAESCSDTDFGINTSVSGTVSGTDQGAPYSYTDFCGNGNLTVIEHYCSGVDPANQTINCNDNITTTCWSGACI